VPVFKLADEHPLTKASLRCVHVVENSDPERPWTFEGEPLYVRRALRVEYTYREQNWDKTDYLIVLYQCSGGCC
jgi:hypothetical protein